MTTRTRKKIEKEFGKLKIHPDGFPVSKALHRGGAGIVTPIVQAKPWGAEVWLIFTKRYALKIMYFEKNMKFSLQIHRKKEESWFVRSGHPLIQLGKKTVKALPGMVFHCKKQTIHRISAPYDAAEVLEVSSPELHDAIRLADEYKREGKKYNPWK